MKYTFFTTIEIIVTTIEIIVFAREDRISTIQAILNQPFSLSLVVVLLLKSFRLRIMYIVTCFNSECYIVRCCKLKFEFLILSNKHFYKFAGPQKPLKTHNQTQMNTPNTHACPTHLAPNQQQHKLPFKHPKQNKAILELAKDHSGINDSTMSSVLHGENAAQIDDLNENSNQNAIGFHMAAKYVNASKVQEEEQSNTRLISYKHDKIKVDLDEEVTCKVLKPLHEAIKKQIKKEAAPANTEKKKLPNKNLNYVDVKQDEQKTMKPHIPYNQAVQKIIQGKSLRERFSSLLRDEEKYSIGYSHRRLLKILKHIDTTIEFATMTKSMRVYFLFDLKNNIRENLSIDISKKQICQLLFIDTDLFKLDWAMNFATKRYDLLITLPPIKSHDERQSKTRKAIVQYLFAKEVEYLAEKKLQKIAIDTWSPGFNPELYEIPEKQLPIHPEFKDCEIRALDREKIENIPNSHLKQFFMKKKEESQERSMCARDVQKMIFSKKSNAEIAERLVAAVKEKEAKMLNLDTSKLLMDKDMLKQVCEEILVRYMGRNVSNIPKATLLDLLNKKFTGWKLQSITQCLQTILQAVDIGYLKEIVSMNKIVICQINKDKFKEMVAYLQKKQLE